MRKAMFSLAVMAIAGVSSVAAAHAFLDHAVPAVGSTVAVAPTQIRLFFSEAIEPHFSAITLAGPDSRPIATSAAAPDPKDPAQFVLPVPRLPPGRYKVSWHVVSVDTHRTSGDFTFTVGR